MHALPVRVLESPRLVGPAGRRPAADRQHLRARVVDDQPLPMSLLVEEPDSPVGPDTRLPDESRVGRQWLQASACELVLEQSVSTLDAVHEEQSRGVGPPVRDEDGSLEVDLEVAPLAGREIPDPRPLIASTLVLERQPRIALHWRPALREQGHPFVELVADGVSRARVDHLERGVDQVAVLGVLEAKQRSVCGERSEQEARPRRRSRDARTRSSGRPRVRDLPPARRRRRTRRGC